MSRPARAVAIGSLITAALVPAAIIACSSSPGKHRVARRTVPAAQPSPTPSPESGAPGYLALGDSVAFGYRPASVTPSADYMNPANFTGYPEDLAKALRLHLVNASCPGETTASMISQSAPSNGCETTPHGSPGYRRLVPLHASYRGSQLGYAVRYLRQHPGTRLVTIDIGANDLSLCEETTADHCTGADFGKTLAAVTGNLDTILSELRDEAHYQRTIVVLSYYALSYGDQAAVGVTQALNRSLAVAAARHNARLASGYAAFRAASVSAGGDTCAAGLRIRLRSAGCDEHPDAHGQQLLAEAIERVVGQAGR